MDSPPPALAAAPHHSKSHRHLWWIALAIALSLYGGLLAVKMVTYAGGSDSSGYLNNARLFREGHVRIERRAIAGLPADSIHDYSYIPLGFIPVGTSEMVPTYPIGLSLLILAVSPFSGWEAAPGATLWLHGMAGVLLMFALAREFGLSRLGSLFAALLLATCPLYLYYSLQAMSDVPALVWCAAAVVAAWHTRRHDRWAIPAGLAFAIAVLVRPSNVLIFFPVALGLGLGWRRWFWFALGGAPAALLLGFFNHALYGKIFTSGYGDIGSSFSPVNVPITLAHYASWLPVLLTPGVALVLAFPWLARREPWSLRIALTGWILSFLAFYAFYYHTHEVWWYLRFLLPAFPPLILAMLLAGRTLLAALLPNRWRSLGPMVAAAALVWSGFWINKLNVIKSGGSERVYRETALWAQAHLPPNAVIATMQTSGSLFFYTDFTLFRWDQLQPGKLSFAAVEQACAATGRPLYAILFPYEIEEKQIFQHHLPGRWDQIGHVRLATIWRYTPESPPSHHPDPARP